MRHLLGYGVNLAYLLAPFVCHDDMFPVEAKSPAILGRAGIGNIEFRVGQECSGGEGNCVALQLQLGVARSLPGLVQAFQSSVLSPASSIPTPGVNATGRGGLSG